MGVGGVRGGVGEREEGDCDGPAMGVPSSTGAPSATCDGVVAVAAAAMIC